jgi:hypothetical protein
MRSPKEQFIDTPESKEFAKLIERPEFERAITSALAQMSWIMPPGSNPVVAAHSAAEIEGAKKFIAIFTGLPNRPKPISPITGLEKEEPVD